MQSAFASSLGHRENVGQYYMSVNKRGDYQFVAPHSEGTSFINMQLASFYCYENNTDGGETVLMNVDQEARGIWDSLRENVRRGKATRALTTSEIRQIKIMARLSMPGDALKEEDEIISRKQINDVFSVYDVLAKPVKSYSQLLGKDVFVYWDSVEAVDTDSLGQFYSLLKSNGLLRLPPGGLDMEAMDDSSGRRIRCFGSRYDQIFKCKITRKLQPGEFVVQNNLTWCHAVSNWTPASGTRKVVAAFA